MFESWVSVTVEFRNWQERELELSVFHFEGVEGTKLIATWRFIEA
jgi:uncharacterized ubiquitin-like protein YukD